MKIQNRYLILAAVVLAACLSVSCQTMDQAIQSAASIAAKSGYLPAGTEGAVLRTGTALAKAAEKITDEQEYYLGRSVAVNILDMYGYYDNPELQKYVNKVGMAVLSASGTPDTFGGYHFVVLNSEEVNAMASPGGIVFVTVGTLKLITNEDQLACVLAHEISHVQLKHGVGTIKSSRMSDLTKVVASEAGNYALKQYTDIDIGNLKDIMEGAIGDITKELVTNGYSRGKEFEADKMAIDIAAKAGYNPIGLKQFLIAMESKTTGDTSGGWFKTHPKAADRITKADKILKSLKVTDYIYEPRTARFVAVKDSTFKLVN